MARSSSPIRRTASKALNASPLKQLDFNGVYRLAPDGTVTLLDRSLSFPNGIELSPDERVLYVANSDPQRPIWIAYDLNAAGEATGRRIFADASDLMSPTAPGLPDGMAMSAEGHLFATGPEVCSCSRATVAGLGRISTGAAIANCAFSEDGRTLYLTPDHHAGARATALIRLLLPFRSGFSPTTTLMSG